MTRKLTDLQPFADDDSLKTAVAKWRRLAAELEAASATENAARLRSAFRHAVAAVRQRKPPKPSR